MREIITLLTANFKQRKAQSLLTLVIITAASLMFTTAIAVTTSVGRPFDEMYKKLNASQIQLANMSGVFDTGTVAKWWEKNRGVTVQTFKTRYSTDRLEYQGETFTDGAVFFTEKPDRELVQDKLAIVEGVNRNCPASGEVWVAISFADKHKMKVGDTLGVSTKDGLKQMKISAIVADPQFGAPAMGVLRFWVAPGELEKMFEPSSADGDFIGIRFDDYSRRDALWHEFEDYLGQPFTATVFDYELVSTAYTLQYQYMGAILLIFAFILLIIAVLIIAFTISAAVSADVKTIGILKAQGFTPLAVTVLYASQYLVLAALSVPMGVLLSRLVLNTIAGMLTKSMGVTSMQLSLILPGLAAFAVLVAIVGTVAFLTARKAGKLKPVSAIREELIEPKQVRTFSFKRFGFIPVAVLVALRQIFVQKSQSLLLLLVGAALAATFTFSVNIVNTFAHVSDKASEWGFDIRNDTISFNENADSDLRAKLLKLLREDSRVKTVLPVGNTEVETRVVGQDPNHQKEVALSVFKGDMDSIGVINIEGRNPISDNEISVTKNVKQEFGKGIGDYIQVNIAGKKLNLLITGVYQSPFRLGWQLRAQSSLLMRAIPGYELQSYAVVFKDAAGREEFVKDYKQKFGDKIDIQPFGETLNGYLYGTTLGINSFVIMLGSIFAIVIFIIVFNSTLVNIYRDKKVFGIFRSLGMTPLQVRLSIVWRVLILTGASLCVGIPASYFGATKIMGMMLSNIGFEKFPMVPTQTGMLAVIPACLLIGFVSAWIPSGQVLKISPRSLIME